LHVVAPPPGQMLIGPGQSTMSQFCVPACPAGQRATHIEAPRQVTWHGPLSQTKRHELFIPQVPLPFAISPVHDWFMPSHST
jgi:hypothetical protein